MTEREQFDRLMTAAIKRMSSSKSREAGRPWLLSCSQARINQVMLDLTNRAIEKGDRTPLDVFWYMHRLAEDPSLLHHTIGEYPGDRSFDYMVVDSSDPKLYYAVELKGTRFDREERPVSPPASAEFVLRLLLPREQRQHAIGDLIEEYHTEVLPRFGIVRANVWFWHQTLTSVIPALYMHLRALCKFVLFLKAAEWIRRIGG